MFAFGVLRSYYYFFFFVNNFFYTLNLERFAFFFLQTQFFFISIFFLFFIITIVVFLVFFLQDILLVFTIFDLVFSLFATLFAILSLYFFDLPGMLFFFIIIAVVGCELSVVLGFLVSFSRRSFNRADQFSPTIAFLRFVRG